VAGEGKPSPFEQKGVFGPLRDHLKREEANMAVVTSTIKGQIVIPADIRKKHKIEKGSRLKVYEEQDKIIVEPLHADPVQEGMGLLKTKGRILKALIADRKRESKQ
jgi:AbrB family looped-hinge helix DNA binding protein